jgi:hypothetical protein
VGYLLGVSLGASLGFELGWALGLEDGLLVGAEDGVPLGAMLPLGAELGTSLGANSPSLVGTLLGVSLGDMDPVGSSLGEGLSLGKVLGMSVGQTFRGFGVVNLKHTPRCVIALGPFMKISTLVTLNTLSRLFRNSFSPFPEAVKLVVTPFTSVVITSTSFSRLWRPISSI